MLEKLIYSTFLLFLLTAQIHAQEILRLNADGKCVFKFTNKSAVPIVITNVKTSCGCTSPRWPKKPQAPATSNEIVVKYNTKLIGPFTKTITISTSAGQSILLTIKGEVTKE